MKIIYIYGDKNLHRYILFYKGDLLWQNFMELKLKQVKFALKQDCLGHFRMFLSFGGRQPQDGLRKILINILDIKGDNQNACYI